MFFFTRIRVPRFTSTDYEKQINAKILGNAQSGNNCDALFELQKQASNMAQSLHQLRGTITDSEIKRLEDEIKEAIIAILNGSRISFVRVNNSLCRLKINLENKSFMIQSGNCVYLLANSILASCAVLSLIGSVGMIATGPIGVVFLGLGIAAVSALILMATAYSLYVDTRAVLGLQLKEIEKGVEFLKDNYELPQRVEGPQRDPSLTDQIPEGPGLLGPM